MKLIHSASALFPNSFVRPLNDDTGKISFQLEKFAAANGVAHSKAHDAMGDVEATLGVAKIIMERCPEVWNASLKTTSKQNVFNLMNQDQVFCVSRFFRGKEYTHGLAYICKHPTYENQVYCFDLKRDPDMIFDLERSDLKKLFKGKDKCFHIVKANEQPILLDEKGEVERLYPSMTIPFTYIIDRQGRIVARVDGAKNWESSETFEAIEYLLKNRN